MGVMAVKPDPVLLWADAFYKRVFPGIARCKYVHDTELQQRGVDKLLQYPEGSPMADIAIDEKIRYTLYPDILLEEYADYEKRTPGWLTKDGMLCDYIAYIFREEKLIYLLPYRDLRDSWEGNHEQWIAKYGRRFGETKRNGEVIYRTSNVPVPLAELGVESLSSLWD